MQLKDHDLRQIDEESLRRLHARDSEALLGLSVRLLCDLKEARERLNQTPQNSSRPPSSQGPWQGPKVGEEAPEEEEPFAETERAAVSEAPPEHPEASGKEDEAAGFPTEADPPPPPPPPAPKRRPGKQPGATGVARTQEIPVTKTVLHLPTHCARCGCRLPEERASPFTAFGVLEIELGTCEKPGLFLLHLWHIYHESRCECGHLTREEPYRAPPEGETWEGVALTAWRLVGSSLAAFLVWLHLRLHLPVRAIRALLEEALGLRLAIGTIEKSLLESARACDPLQAQLFEALVQAETEVLYADETPHRQGSESLYLWTLASLYTVLFAIGPRSKATFQAMLGSTYAGWLMSDGYAVYRDYPKRLRCWAHLLRKAQGLVESLSTWPVYFGRQILATLQQLMGAIYAVRSGALQAGSLRSAFRGHLDALKSLCERMVGSRHKKTHQLGTEFLNDWEAIFRILDHPHLPLTNNEAERILRPWVILRRITYGTRTPQGSRALALMASVLVTCYRRGASPLRYLAQVIAARRQGLPVPPLPPIPVAG